VTTKQYKCVFCLSLLQIPDAVLKLSQGGPGVGVYNYNLNYEGDLRSKASPGQNTKPYEK
jgi:hypothetical protein